MRTFRLVTLVLVANLFGGSTRANETKVGDWVMGTYFWCESPADVKNFTNNVLDAKKTSTIQEFMLQQKELGLKCEYEKKILMYLGNDPDQPKFFWKDRHFNLEKYLGGDKFFWSWTLDTDTYS